MKFYYEWYISDCKRDPRSRIKNNRKIDKGFIDWIKKVEDKVLLVYGLMLLDLPDENYMYMYENGVNPERMADKIFENNKI